MTNILAERIKNANLTKTQKKIADYFISNQERIGSLSSIEAAQEIGVSDASIIRFSRAIGFDGFADLKDNIYDMLVQNAVSGLSLSERVKKNSETYKNGNVPEQFQNIMHQNLVSVFRNNSPESFEKLAQTIVHARNRYVIGLRGCRGTALNFGRLLTFMLPNVHCLIDGECASINLLQDIGEGDILVMFVLTRYYKIDIECLELAKKKGATICIIQNELTGPLNKYADLLFVVSTIGMGFFNSTMSMQMIAEYTLTLIGHHVDYKERLEQKDYITREQRL